MQLHMQTDGRKSAVDRAKYDHSILIKTINIYSIDGWTE